MSIFRRLIIVNLLILIGVMSINLFYDIPTAQKYYQSDLMRTNYLIELKEQGHKDLVELEPLYKPTTFNLKYLITKSHQPLLYYYNEIEKDTAGYNVGCVKIYYEIDFPFRLK